MDFLVRCTPPGARVCGSCTSCCKTHAVSGLNLEKKMGKWCKHCNIGHSCKIYSTRPEQCRDFSCEWLKGVGNASHRPDRTKIVLDFFNLPDGLPGGVLQVWEVSENALDSEFLKVVTQEALASGVWVSHIYLQGLKKVLFVPENKFVDQDIEESCKQEGMEIRYA